MIAADVMMMMVGGLFVVGWVNIITTISPQFAHGIAVTYKKFSCPLIPHFFPSSFKATFSERRVHPVESKRRSYFGLDWVL
jgi:hypothetical protein